MTVNPLPASFAPHTPSWRLLALRILQIFGIYLFALGLAALLTPPITTLLHWAGWASLSHERVFDRLRWLGVLAALPLLWRWSNLHQFKNLKFGNYKKGLLWMLAGALSVVFLSAIMLMDTPGKEPFLLSKLLRLVGQGIIVGLAVACIEEVLFRGILQRIFTYAGGAVAGIFITSIIYAWLHGRPESIAGEGFWGSWQLAIQHIATWPKNLSLMSFLNLGLLGVALGVIYWRSGKLFNCIGLHAGIVAAAVPCSAILQAAQPGLGRTAMLESPLTTILLLAWVVVGLCQQTTFANAAAAKESAASR